MHFQNRQIQISDNEKIIHRSRIVFVHSPAVFRHFPGGEREKGEEKEGEKGGEPELQAQVHDLPFGGARGFRIRL